MKTPNAAKAAKTKAPARPTLADHDARKTRRDKEAKAATKAAAAPVAKVPRTDTKQAKMIEMLRRPTGATLDEIVAETGWQKHTVRGAMAGALKKRLGLKVESVKEERGRVYRVAA